MNERPVLYAWLPCAPFSPFHPKGWGKRGLHPALWDERSFAPMVDRYWLPYAALANSFGIRLDRYYVTPWGRPEIWAQWHFGYTTYRSDAPILAARDRRFSWLNAALAESVEFDPSRCLLYTGAHPSHYTLESCGALPWLRMGCAMAFDALASIRKPTTLGADIVRKYRGVSVADGALDLRAEANRRSEYLGRMRCTADRKLWTGKPNRYTLADAAKPSIATYRHGVLDIEDWKIGDTAASLGHRLAVNLDKMSDASIRRLFSMVGRKAT